MRGLEEEYRGKVQFTVLSAASLDAKAEIKEYELGSHGLVALSAAGEKVHTIPGHEFGRDEIVEAVQKLLP